MHACMDRSHYSQGAMWCMEHLGMSVDEAQCKELASANSSL